MIRNRINKANIYTDTLVVHRFVGSLQGGGTWETVYEGYCSLQYRNYSAPSGSSSAKNVFELFVPKIEELDVPFSESLFWSFTAGDNNLDSPNAVDRRSVGSLNGDVIGQVFYFYDLVSTSTSTT